MIFKAFGIHFSQVGLGEIYPGVWCFHSCLPFCVWGWSPQFALTRTQGHLTHTSQPKNLTEGFRHFRSDFTSAFSVLITRRTFSIYQGCPAHSWVSLVSDGSSRWDLLPAETPDGLSEHLVGLPVIDIQFMSEYLPRLRSVSRFMLRVKIRLRKIFKIKIQDYAPQRTVNAKKSRLYSEAMPLGYFLCLNSVFHLCSTKGYFFCHNSPHRIASVRVPEQQLKQQLLWTAATLCPLCILGRNKDDELSAMVFHLCLPRPLY